jgi:hypothetical protein
MRRHRRVVVVPLIVCMVGTTAGAAAQQDEPPPGTLVGGNVPSMLGLRLAGGDGFARFPSAPVTRTYELRIQATATATEAGAELTIADGEVVAGPRRGHLASRSTVLPAPLEATVGAAAFASLDAPLGARLKQWGDPVTNARATVRLRQRVSADRRSERAPFRKVLLITLTPNGP